jgi:hypothetical protein
VIWTLAPLGILAVLVAIDWAAGRRRGRPWAYQACACLHPDPEGDDPHYMHRCRNCGDWFDHWNCQPPRKDHP